MGDADASDYTFGYHFRGRSVIDATLSELVRSQGLGRRERGGESSGEGTGENSAATPDVLLFGGGSAGARGALLHLEYIQQMLPELPMALSTELPMALSTELPMALSTELPMALSTELPMALSTELPMALSTELPMALSTELPMALSTHPSRTIHQPNATNGSMDNESNGSNDMRSASINASEVRRLRRANVLVRGFLDSPLWIDVAPLYPTVTSLADRTKAVFERFNVTHTGHRCSHEYPRGGTAARASVDNILAVSVDIIR
jgi:hypothetical protein